MVGALSPAATLAALHEVEADLGRTRTRRWEARACDLDLIAAGATILPDAATLRRWIEDPAAARGGATPDRLILPHPRLQDRGFVLAPLAEIAADWRHPVLGVTVAEMLAALPAAAVSGLDPV